MGSAAEQAAQGWVARAADPPVAPLAPLRRIIRFGPTGRPLTWLEKHRLWYNGLEQRDLETGSVHSPALSVTWGSGTGELTTQHLNDRVFVSCIKTAAEAIESRANDLLEGGSVPGGASGAASAASAAAPAASAAASATAKSVAVRSAAEHLIGGDKKILPLMRKVREREKILKTTGGL